MVYYYLPYIYILGIISILYGSLNTLRQIDVKKMIAYSSVAHMGLVFLAIMCLGYNRIYGSIYLMIGHRITSSRLFIIVSYLYNRFNSRIINYYRGTVHNMPI